MATLFHLVKSVLDSRFNASSVKSNAAQPNSQKTSTSAPNKILTLQKSIGNWAEELAAQTLKKKGLRILHRNWMHGADELDIIALDENLTVFVEVRARKFNARVPGAQTLNKRKRTALKRAISFYLRSIPDSISWRSDIIEVSYQNKEKYELFHYEGVNL